MFIPVPVYIIARGGTTIAESSSAASLSAQSGHKRLSDLFDCRSAVDLRELTILPVVLDHRLRLLGIYLNTLGDHLGVIVFPLEEISVAPVADSGPRRRRVLGVVRRLAAAAEDVPESTGKGGGVICGSGNT